MFRAIALLEEEPPSHSQVFLHPPTYFLPGLTLTSFPVPSEVKHLYSMMFSPPFHRGVFRVVSSLKFVIHIALCTIDQNNSTLVLSSTCLWCLSSNKSFILPFFHKDQVCRVHGFKLTCRQILWPELWISAAPPRWPWASWLLLLSSHSVTFSGEPCLDRIAGVPHYFFSFHFRMIAWPAVLEVVKACFSWCSYSLEFSN